MKRTTKLTIYGWFWEIVWLIKNPNLRKISRAERMYSTGQYLCERARKIDPWAGKTCRGMGNSSKLKSFLEDN